jgi:hypothetical protein
MDVRVWSLLYLQISGGGVPSVDREMDKEFHFPFSIFDLIFAIARKSPNVH